jgi:hypothetical protein
MMVHTRRLLPFPLAGGWATGGSKLAGGVAMHWVMRPGLGGGYAHILLRMGGEKWMMHSAKYRSAFVCFVPLIALT